MKISVGQFRPGGDVSANVAMMRELAQEAGVPPYVIFHDSVLRDMAAQRPASRAALALLSGIGARKLDAYGDAFLQVIREAA